MRTLDRNGLEKSEIKVWEIPVNYCTFWTALKSYKYKIGDHSFSTYAKFSEKLIFLTPWYAHVRVRIRG